jgi:tellurite resistance protein TehA-like permease
VVWLLLSYRFLAPVALVVARSTVEGFTLCLWALGCWLTPFLIMVTAWRYRSPTVRVYEQTLWSIVFSLGTYAVATAASGGAAGQPLLTPIAGAEIWLALAARPAVAFWMVTW